VNHRRRNQKGECNAKRQTCACKPDKQRNGRTRAKRCYRTEQSGDDIRPYSVKSAEYLFSSFGREITLNIRDNQNQNAEQYHNFYSIIDEKLNTSSYLPVVSKPQAFKNVSMRRFSQFIPRTSF